MTPRIKLIRKTQTAYEFKIYIDKGEWDWHEVNIKIAKRKFKKIGEPQKRKINNETYF